MLRLATIVNAAAVLIFGMLLLLSSFERSLAQESKSDAIDPAAELTGIVVDTDGNPLADVLIDAWSWYPGNETRTDASGRFRLKLDEQPKRVELRVMKDGFSPFYKAQQAIGERDFRVVLGRKTYIEGTVFDTDGKPARNVEVRGEQGPQRADGVMIGQVTTKTKTDDRGSYRLYVHPDTYQLLVRTESGQVARLSNIVVKPNESKKQDIELVQGIRFEANVLDSVSKKPVSDFVLSHFLHPGVLGRSNAEGKLVINGMIPGEFEFNVGEGDAQKSGPFTVYLPRTIARWWSKHAKVEWQRESNKKGTFQTNFDDLTFDMTPGMEPVTIFVERGVTFTGRVTDPNGKGVEGATVAPALTGSGNSLTGDTRFSTKTDAEGKYSVVMPAGKGFKYNLMAHDGDYQEWRTWANGVTDPIETQPAQKFDDFDIQLTRPRRFVDA